MPRPVTQSPTSNRSSSPATQAPAPRRLLACLCLALSMALVGSYVALSKPLVAAFGVMLLAWLRFGIGAVAMSRWLAKPADEPPLDPRTRWLVFLESLLGNFLFSICMLYGVSLTSAVTAGLVMAGIPAMVALLSRVFLREHISARTGIGIALSVLGIVFYMLSKQELPMQYGRGPMPDLAPQYPLGGYLLLAAAVVCESAYAVIGKRLSASMGPKRIAALINLWGFALMTPFGVWLALSFDFGAVAAGQWLLLLAYGLAASVWTVWLWMTGLRTIPAAQAGVFTVMLPLAAALTGVLVLGESLTLPQWLAFGVALAGVVLATTSPLETAR